MQRIVIKFGGTSVSSLENWQHIVEIINQHQSNYDQVIVVCSALSQISNQLEQAISAALINQYQDNYQLIKQRYLTMAATLKVNGDVLSTHLTQLQKLLEGVALLQEASAKTRAQIMASGELLLTMMAVEYLRQQNIDATWLDARDILKTVNTHGGDEVNYLAARCNYNTDQQLIDNCQLIKQKVIITQGFIASNEQGETVLLGRGGSDSSAAIIAAKIAAKRCEIWTDVPGIYTANPYEFPQARLLKQLNYNEAQEIASMGAKVLHPNCIPPVKQNAIPLFVKYTRFPQHPGSQISNESDEHAPPIKSIQIKNNVTLISIDTLNMWQQVGFLADVFACFKQHGFSVDLLSTSEFNVTLSLDTNASLKSRQALDGLLSDLNKISRARLIEACAVVSLVGQNIRTILPQLGPSLEVFESEQIHMMSLAANDLNLSFVVNESQAAKLSQKLHALLIENNPLSFYYSKTWQEEFGEATPTVKSWWHQRRQQLLEYAETNSPCYVYDRASLEIAARSLLSLQAIDQLFYAVKANCFDPILQLFYQLGLSFECVSLGELKKIQHLFPDISPQRILFTPNFAAKNEYDYALKLGCYVTIDNTYPLEQWPELFANKAIILRIDPGNGAGHHKYVITGGNESKFGIPQSEISKVKAITEQHQINVIGLHAHFGSGILKPDIWQQTALLLSQLSEQFNKIEIINLGGGLGIVERPGQTPLDLTAMDESLLQVKQQYPQLKFWLEPGRYLVANSGIILAKVTQTKQKDYVNFIGIETGMNSLIRPSLYGSYHDIVNLSKLDEEKQQLAHIVGPICESGDTLGYSRLMPNSVENDVILIANTGAYGYSMSSNYNLREPAKQYLL